MLFLTIMATTVLIIPGIAANKAKESAWISVMIATGVCLAELFLVYNIGKRFPQYNPVQYVGILMSKFWGKILGLSYVIYFLVISIVVSREFSDFINITLMPDTPKLVFHISLMLLCAYAVSKELEVIARVSQFIMPLFVLALTFLIAFSVLNVDLSQLMPFFDNGLVPVLDGAKVPASIFGQVVILLFLMPLTNKPQEVLKKCSIALLAAGFFLIFITVLALGILSPELTGSQLFPFLSLAKLIKVASVQRLEFIVIFIWVSGIVVKIALLYYLECAILVQVFSLKRKGTVMLILGLLQTFLSYYLFRTTSQVGAFITIIWPFIALFFSFCIPMFLLGLIFIKRKEVRRLK